MKPCVLQTRRAPHRPSAPGSDDELRSLLRLCPNHPALRSLGFSIPAFANVTSRELVRHKTPMRGPDAPGGSASSLNPAYFGPTATAAMVGDGSRYPRRVTSVSRLGPK